MPSPLLSACYRVLSAYLLSPHTPMGVGSALTGLVALGRHPRNERGAGSKMSKNLPIAAKLFGVVPAEPQASQLKARKRRYRERQRLGQCVLRVVAPEHDLAEALLEAGRLTDDENGH